MFEHDFVGRLGLCLGILVLAGACAVGEIGDTEGTPRLGPGYEDNDGGVGETPQVIPPGGDADPDRPGAHNTGPYDRGILTPYTGPTTITQDGATYENFTYGSKIIIDADNVALRNFVMDLGGKDLGVIVIESGHSGILIEHGELTRGATAINGAGFTARYLHIHEGNDDGFKLGGGAGGPTLIEYCFMERMGTEDGSHADGMQSRQTSLQPTTFRYNNFWLPDEGTPNWPGSPYKVNSNFYFSSSTTNAGFVIDSNWLNGGGYTIYCNDVNDQITVTNNRFGRDYKYNIVEGSPASCKAWTSNVWDDTGLPAP